MESRNIKHQAKIAENEEKHLLKLLLRQESVLDTLKNENKQYRESNNGLKSQITENKSKIQSISHQNCKLVEDNNKLREHLSISQKHSAFFMNQLKAIKNKEKDIKTVLNETEEKMKELNKSEKPKTKIELINKIAQLKSVLNSRVQNKQEQILWTGSEQKKYEHVTISESIAIKQEVIITLNEQNMQLIEEKCKLEAELGRTQSKIEQLNSENLVLGDEKKSLKEQINSSQKYNAHLLSKLNKHWEHLVSND